MAVAVAPLATVKTVEALLPSTVTRLVNEAPLPVVAPVIVVFDGMFSVPLVSVIVCAVANAVGSNVMFPEPSLAALASAARNEPTPESFVFTTTKLGMLTEIFPDVPVRLTVTVSVVVIVWLPTVISVAENVPVPLISVLSAGNTAPGSVLVKNALCRFIPRSDCWMRRAP